MIRRISQFIENQGISVSAFEQKISASDGMIRRAIGKGTDIQSKWIANISDNYPDLNLEWLITGKGEMLKSTNPQSKEYEEPNANTSYVSEPVATYSTPLTSEYVAALQAEIRELKQIQKTHLRIIENLSAEKNKRIADTA